MHYNWKIGGENLHSEYSHSEYSRCNPQFCSEDIVMLLILIFWSLGRQLNSVLTWLWVRLRVTKWPILICICNPQNWTGNENFSSRVIQMVLFNIIFCNHTSNVDYSEMTLCVSSLKVLFFIENIGTCFVFGKCVVLKFAHNIYKSLCFWNYYFIYIKHDNAFQYWFCTI